MADVSATRASTQATQWVNAPREVVYRAFLDQDAVAAWQHPDGMRLQIHEFEPGEGGRFRVSLTYENAADSPGKTSDTTDTYHGWFARLIPYTTITQVVEFESAKEEFAGEMRITVTLATGIPEERCQRINLGYADYREIDPTAWVGREEEGILYVPHAGERLYRMRGDQVSAG